MQANYYISTDTIRSAGPDYGLLAISTKKKIAQDPMTSHSRVKRERLVAFIVDWECCISVDQGCHTSIGQAVLNDVDVELFVQRTGEPTGAAALDPSGIYM